MKIIALYGKGNCGKSETLGVHLRNYFHSQMNPAPVGILKKDERESLTFEGKVIDICPPGDNETIVLDNIAFIKANTCDVAFTATRSRGKGCVALKKYADHCGAELIWVKKPYNDDLSIEGQYKANKTFALELIKMI